MAIRQDIPADEEFFAGTDRELEFEMLRREVDGAGAPVVPEVLVPVDVAGRALALVLRTKATGATALLTKTTSGGGITVDGVFNAVRATNTQRVHVAVGAGDTRGFLEQQYQYALKRMDTGLEDVYTYGDLVLLVAAAR